MWRWIVIGLFVTALVIESPETASSRSADERVLHPVYPRLLDDPPQIASPCRMEDGREILVATLKNGKHAFMPVTVENGKPLHYSRRIPCVYGKDQQLYVDRGDFPTLAETGLHREAELDAKNMITGLPVEVITYVGRPGRFSGAGFMADDEDILSVLRGDNTLVRALGLTHPQMARPLFHVWNMILQEIEAGTLARFSNVQHFVYNGRKVSLQAEGTKGWQVSIFQDEIQGRFDLDVRRSLVPAEESLLQRRYSQLSQAQMAQMREKLTHLHFSEMAPYYIMRYGFYEGHTTYRADPITIACIFGLKTIEGIEEALPGHLYRALTHHFTAPDAAR
jgi:hypothetical protein